MKNVAKLLVPALLATAFETSCAADWGNTKWDPGSQAPIGAHANLPKAFLGATTVMVGAGDIAFESTGAEATAKLLDTIPGTVFALGDNAYQTGSPAEFAKFYEPTWGRHKARTRPAVGNHEYRTPGAAGYYNYFGAAAGDRTKGYYAYDVSPDWHVVVINSATTGDDASKNLGPTSEQYRWLEQDLDAHKQQNVVSMWHHPRFSSGVHGDNVDTDAIWRLLDAKGVDIALWGHDHHYERFYPIDGLGQRNDTNGIQSFVVGTGGRSHYAFIKPAKSMTAVRNAKTFGVLKLTLAKEGYEWEFVPEAGESFVDSGRAPVR